MSFQDHLKACSYCNKDSQKVTISIKSASSYYKDKKLSELASIIKGVSYPGISYAGIKKTNANIRTKTNAKGASNPQIQRKPGYLERQFKLMELGKMIRDFVG
jgi:hypothetical protein